MLCEICDTQLGLNERVETYFDYSVSSDNRFIDKKIELFQCGVCGHFQKKSNRFILNSLYDNYVVDVLAPNEGFFVKEVNGKYVERSSRILEISLDYISTNVLSCLDIGSGGGDMLRSLSNYFVGANIFACDLSRHNEEKFKKDIPKFRKMWENLYDIDQQFDLITMVHTLEHMSELKSVLNKIKNILSKDGFLIIQVPDIQNCLLDIYTYDHLHHFSVETLCYLIEQVGLKWIIPKNQLDRQITIVCSRGGGER